jgi:hypothetical protein
VQNNFLTGVISSLTATAIVAVMFKWAWPTFKDKCLYNGVRVDGSWEIMEVRNGKQTKVGRIELKQHGRIVTGSSVRSKTREGKTSNRKFRYRGAIQGHQMTLMFEDVKGVGFDTGTYVFTVHNDCKTMIGMATFHGKSENQIVSEPRTLLKVLS